MADDDFEIEGMAAYLHLHPSQVVKLAERGQLPGRKVGGQWRFSPAEIHHWLENRIGLSSEEELVEMEGVLSGQPQDAEIEAISIAKMLPVEAIAIPLPARTRGSAITDMVELAAKTGWVWDATRLADAVRAREDMAPTALDNGVALLHPRRPLPNILDRAFLAFGRTSQGIAFGGARGVMTDLFFVICSLDDRGHLRTLARLSRLLTDPQLLADLRSAADSSAAWQVIADREARFGS